MTGFEPLLATGAAYLSGMMLEVLKDKGKVEGGNFFSRLLNRDIGKDVEQAYYQAAGKYVEIYAERHGTLKVLGMREPVKLDDVFTTVQFLAEDEVKRFATPETLEQTFRKLGRGFYHWSEERRDGISVAGEKQFVMVLGQPGAGKSTFLRKIGLEALKGKKGQLRQLFKIPVFLELKRFTKSEIDLKALITNEFETCGFPKAKEFTQSALEQGKLLILLDGLDEVPAANINPVIDAIQDFVDRYDKNRYIASCRTAAYRGNFRRFSDVIISDFSDEQIQQFINNWFRSEEDKQSGTAVRCWELLRKPENQAAKELAHTPLLLTLLCLVYDELQTFSNNRSGLYQEALRILLEKWAAEKRILPERIYEGLNVKLEEVLLSEVAYTGFKSDRLFVLKPQLVEQIAEFLASNLNAPKDFDGEAVLGAIAIQQGILVERTTDVYSFSHLTLQEYLTARYICAHSLFSQMAEQNLFDDRWREVFLLTSGLMLDKGADELLKAMHEAAKRYAQYPKVRALLQWADQVTAGSTGAFKPAAKRAVAIVIIRASDIDGAETRYLARYLARNLDVKIDETIDIDETIESFKRIDNASDIADDKAVRSTEDISIVQIDGMISTCARLQQNGIFKELDFSSFVTQLRNLQSTLKSQDKTQIQNVAKQVVDTYMKVFQLTETLSRFNEDESKALKTYLNSLTLLLKCKQEAARLSPATWEAIEAELFLPPDTT